jgi:hypothetical protein
MIDRKLRVSAAPQLVDAIAEMAFKDVAGVRGVQRAIDIVVGRPLTRLLNEQVVRNSRAELSARALSRAVPVRPRLGAMPALFKRWVWSSSWRISSSTEVGSSSPMAV